MTPEEIERQRRMRRIREQALINRAQSDRGWMGDSSPGGGIYSLPPPAASAPDPFFFTNSILGDGGLDYALYDSSTLDRMWQESTGQTPADLSLPVGLIVGREKQAAKTFAQVMAGQPELVVNGAFPTNLVGWNITQTGTGTMTWEAGKARAVGTDGSANAGRIDQTFTNTAGKLYVLTVDVGVNSGQAAVLIGTSGGGGQVFGVSIGAGTFQRYFVALGGTMYASFRNSTGGGDVTFDNVSVKEVPAHYASQASAGARPVLQSDGLKFDGSDDNLLTDWFAQAGANCIIAQIVFPATIASTQFIAGTQNTNGRLRLAIDASGNILPPIGDANAGGLTYDLRGRTSIVCVQGDGAVTRCFADDGQSSAAVAYTGSPNLVQPLRIGANNSAGVAGGFSAAAVKRIAFGKVAPTPEQFQQIRAEWLAAA